MCSGSETEPGRAEKVRDICAGAVGLRLHGVSMCLHQSGLEILLEGAQFQPKPRKWLGSVKYGREVIVEHLRAVRAIEASRLTCNSGFLFLARSEKNSTTCPTSAACRFGRRSVHLPRGHC